MSSKQIGTCIPHAMLVTLRRQAIRLANRSDASTQTLEMIKRFWLTNPIGQDRFAPAGASQEDNQP